MRETDKKITFRYLIFNEYRDIRAGKTSMMKVVLIFGIYFLFCEPLKKALSFKTLKNFCSSARSPN